MLATAPQPLYLCEHFEPPVITPGDDSLEYLTIDSVRWSNASQRPRMDPEERKAKHRIVQRRHMERKRERIAKLNGVISKLEMQLQWLEAVLEARRLEKEQGDLRRRLEAQVEESPSWKRPANAPADALEDHIMTELLAVVEQL